MEGYTMIVSAISSNQYNQNFGGVRKIVTEHGGKILTSFVSEKGTMLGKHVLTKTGDVYGKRTFSNGAQIAYSTSHGSLSKNPYVSMECYLPEKGVKTSNRLLVFDLDKFKENMSELTSLAGIKRYFAKIESAPKTTKFEPCC